MKKIFLCIPLFVMLFIAVPPAFADGTDFCKMTQKDMKLLENMTHEKLFSKKNGLSGCLSEKMISSEKDVIKNHLMNNDDRTQSTQRCQRIDPVCFDHCLKGFMGCLKKHGLFNPFPRFKEQAQRDQFNRCYDGWEACIRNCPMISCPEDEPAQQ